MQTLALPRRISSSSSSYWFYCISALPRTMCVSTPLCISSLHWLFCVSAPPLLRISSSTYYLLRFFVVAPLRISSSASSYRFCVLVLRISSSAYRVRISASASSYRLLDVSASRFFVLVLRISSSAYRVRISSFAY